MKNNYISNHFRFYSYDKRMVNDVHTNNDFQRIKEICLADNNYSLLLVKIFKKLAVKPTSKEKFLEVCEYIKGLSFDLRGINLDINKTDNLFNTLYDITTEDGQWSKIKANIVEYLTFIALRFEGFKVVFEPTVKYKRKNIYIPDKNVRNKKFDVASHINKKLFVLGECKTTLTSYIYKRGNKTFLKKSAYYQVKKINYIYDKLIKSKTINGERIYCNRYLFVLNKVNVKLLNAPNIKIVEIEELFVEPYFLHDLELNLDKT